MIPLTDKENKSYRKQKVCYICKKRIFLHENENDKNENDKMIKCTIK